MFNKKAEELETRIKALEEFLGLTLDNTDPEYYDYRFQVNTYNLKPSGILGELYQAHKKEEKK